MTRAPEPESPDGNLEPSVDSIRAILLTAERERLKQLEAETESLKQLGEREREAFQTAVNKLEEALAELGATATAQEARANQLQQELEELRQQMTAESESLIPKLIQRISLIISQTIRNSRDEMAEALGPIMGDAIRVQIRDSRREMVAALYPIILETVQRAVAEFAREFQRNIDQRLRSTIGPQSWLRRFMARIRGVSAAELALRDALPFQLEQLFLIQHGSGLLLAHSGLPGTDEDSDLIGGMLTAIRAFAHDTFSNSDEDDELEEVQYGERSIIIQSGQNAYLAAVVEGVEPEGFRTDLLRFVSELNVKYHSALRDYNGDPRTLPPLKPQLEALADDLQETRASRPEPMSPAQRYLLVGGGLGLVLVLALACFYLQFTLALLPLAFGETATPTPVEPLVVIITATPMPTSTPPPPTPTLKATATATSTPSPTPTVTPSVTPSITPSATPSPTISRTPLPDAVTTNPVWVFADPSVDSEVFGALLTGVPVTIVSQYGDWVEIIWQEGSERIQGWVGLRWLNLNVTIPPERITPASPGEQAP